MLFFNKKSQVSALFVIGCLAANASAHGRWLLPSHTILSGDSQTVTVDMSISNDIFHPDVPMGGVSLNNLAKGSSHILPSMGELYLLNPEGDKQTRLPVVNLGRKSVTAVELDESGSYRLQVNQAPMMLTFFTLPDGTESRAFGGYEQIKNRLPKGVTDVHTLKLYHYLTTFLSLNDATSLTLDDQGLELQSSTHFNELFNGEKARFELVYQGKPAPAGIPVRITRGGTRFRNRRDSIELQTDEQGSVSFDWQGPGMYLLEAEYEYPVEGEAWQSEGHHLFVTLEVNPE